MNWPTTVNRSIFSLRQSFYLLFSLKNSLLVWPQQVTHSTPNSWLIQKYFGELSPRLRERTSFLQNSKIYSRKWRNWGLIWDLHYKRSCVIHSWWANYQQPITWYKISLDVNKLWKQTKAIKEFENRHTTLGGSCATNNYQKMLSPWIPVIKL